MGDKRALPAAAAQFVLACSFTALYYMVTLTQHRPGGFFSQVLLVYGPLIYGLNRLVLRREPTLRALYGVNVAAGLLALGAYLWIEPWRSGTYLFFAVLFVAWLTVKGCRLALNGADLRGSLLVLDASMAVLVLFMGYTAMTGVALVWSLPAVCGFLAAVVGVTACRSGDGMGWKSWLMMAGAFLVILLGVLVFVGLVAAAAGEGVVALGGGLAAALRGASSALLRGIQALFTLLPDAGSQEIPQYEAPEMEWVGGTAPEESPVSGLLLAAVLLILLAVLALWVIRQLGKVRATTAAPVEGGAPKRERVPFCLGLRALFSTWMDRLKLRVLLWKHRNTPRGLYFILVRRCGRSPWHKGAGETPREFLTRLARAAREDPPLAEALTRLAGEVDVAFYSAAAVQASLEEGPLIRRRLGRAVRRRFFRDRLARRKKKTP